MEIKNFLKATTIALVMGLSLWSCKNNDELDIVIPNYENQLVVECYLQTDKIFKLSLLENVSYFELPRLPVVYEAEVKISFGGDTVELFNILETDTVNQKFFNYISYRKLPATTLPIYLYVKDPKGRVVKGQTTMMPQVLIDNIYESQLDRKEYSLTMNFLDAVEKNYYRCIINKDSVNGEKMIDILTDDKLFQNGKGFIVSGNKFKQGDTLIVRLFHLEEAYFNFLKSVNKANLANEDPFAQPNTVINNVKGGLGIFTFLAVDTKKYIVR